MTLAMKLASDIGRLSQKNEKKRKKSRIMPKLGRR
jgi:hypothetical protein